MICSRCRENTLGSPCASCGAEPRVGGRFRLDAVVGRGAAGMVYRGLDEQTGQVVAIKDMPLVHPDAKTAELAARETRVLQQLDHPAIPKAVDSIIEGGRLFFVQDFVEGRTLREELAEHRYEADEVLAIVEELCGILGYLHSRQPPVIHRDLKPGNVLRRPNGALALVDFGAVRDVLRDPQMGGSTVAGTFGFMAPEQMRGDAWPCTDLYGLGALAVVLLSRQEAAPLMDWSGRFRWKEAISVHPAVEALLEGMLQPDPEQRRSDALALQAEVAELRAQLKAGTAVAPRTPSTPSPRPRVAMLVAMLVLVGVSALAGFLFVGGASEAPPASAEPQWVPPAEVQVVSEPVRRSVDVKDPWADEGDRFALEDGELVEQLDADGVRACVYDSLRGVATALRAYDAAFDNYSNDLGDLGWEMDGACQPWVRVWVEHVPTDPVPTAEGHALVLRGELEGEHYVGSLDGKVKRYQGP